MISAPLIVGLHLKWTKCIPDTIESVLKCVGELNQYVLQTISPGRSVKYIGLSEYGSPNSFNGSFDDTSTLLGQLSTNALDVVLEIMAITDKRAKYIDYGLQIQEDTLCIFLGKNALVSVYEGHSTYFLNVLNKRIKLFFFATLMMYILFKLIIRMRFNSRELFPWFRKATFGFSTICFILFYNNNMKADMMPKTSFRLPFHTVNELVQLVKTDGYYLVINSIEDYRMEMINNSQTTSVRRLKRALTMGKTKVVKSRDKMWRDLRHAGAFTINSLYDFLAEDQKKMQDIVKFCPMDLPKLRVSYGFAKQSKLIDIFNQRANFIHALSQRLLMSKEGRHNYYSSASTPITDIYNWLIEKD